MKKYIFLLLVDLAFSFLFGGCGKSYESTTNRQKLNWESKQTVFPESLVGVWQVMEGEYKGKWGFKFESDGSISKMIHMLAEEVDMKEGDSQLEGKDEGTYAIFITGPYDVNYAADTREFDVKVTLEYFRMEMPIGTVEGSTVDYFRGKLSEDMKTWKVNWVNYGYLEGADDPDPNIIEANPIFLTFKKIDFEGMKQPTDSHQSSN